MKNILVGTILGLGICGTVSADVTCSGKIRNINTYPSDEKLYILLDTTSHYISLNTDISKSVALAAFAAGKTVNFHMVGANITNCSGGPTNNSWDNSTPLNHYLNANT